MAETLKISLKDLKKVVGGQGNNNGTGMNCLRCGTFIPISPMQLINLKIIVCPTCDERYEVAGTRSVQAEEMARQVQEAQENLNNLTK